MSRVLSVVKAPLITEKSTLVSEAGQLVFRVDPHATKKEIRTAVEKLFDCKVAAVRTANCLGKRRRYGRVMGRKPQWKKAYVTLAEGDPAELLEKV